MRQKVGLSDSLRPKIRQTDRQTDRQTVRQAISHPKTDDQTGRQTEIQTSQEPVSQADRQMYGRTERRTKLEASKWFLKRSQSYSFT